MELPPKLEFKTFQTAFTGGVNAAQGVYALKSIAELDKERNEPVVATRIDLKTALDTDTRGRKVFLINSSLCCTECGKSAQSKQN